MRLRTRTAAELMCLIVLHHLSFKLAPTLRYTGLSKYSITRRWLALISAVRLLLGPRVLPLPSTSRQLTGPHKLGAIRSEEPIDPSAFRTPNCG